jgi:hypothetical protein
MFDNDDEDPKKPHEPFHPKKGPTPYEEDGDPWRHCKEEQREATPRSASLHEYRRHV